MSVAELGKGKNISQRRPANLAERTRGTNMVGPRKGTREKAFARRLDKALSDHPRCPEGYGRNAWLKRELTHYNIDVSDETIRRWLNAIAMPRRDKMAALAKLFRVDETWLAMGVQPVEPMSSNDVARAEALATALLEIKEKTDDPEIHEIIERLCADL